MLHANGRHAISRALGEWLFKEGQQKTPEGVPLSTVDDYIHRVKARWAEEAEPKRGETRRRQQRRLHIDLMKAKADKRYTDAIRIERLIMWVEGNEAAKTIEAVLAAEANR